MAEELAAAKLKRRIIKSAQTRFKSFVNNLNPDDDSLLIEVGDRLENFKNLLVDFRETQYLIELLTADGDEATFDTEREEFENIFYKTVADVKKYLARFSNVTDDENSSAPSRTVLTSNRGPNLKRANLPVLVVPHFTGDIENWKCFRDTFDSLVHSRNDMDEIEKFHYLRGALKGPVEHLLDSYTSADSYQSAWQFLEERFENKRLISNKHISALFNMPHLTKESHTDLRKLLDDFSKHLRSLKLLGQPIEHWDALVVYIVSSRFDPITRKEWENYKILGELPTIHEIKKFLNNKCQILETINANKSENEKDDTASKLKKFKSFTTVVQNKVVTNQSCASCKSKAHFIYQCPEFIALSIHDRINETKRLKLCFNCLRLNHNLRECKSKLSCRVCNKRHHSVLHLESSKVEQPPCNQKNPESQKETQSVSLFVPKTQSYTCSSDQTYILLSTALVYITLPNNSKKRVRILLDSGSQSCFITSKLCSELNIPISKVNIAVAGIDQSITNITSKAKVEIQSIYNNFKCECSCLVLPQITGAMPAIPLNVSKIQVPPNIQLADTTYYKPGKVDMLIGANVFWSLISIGQINLGKGMPVLQKTVLGWIVSGAVSQLKSFQNTTVHCHFTSEFKIIQSQLKRFWELDECPSNILTHFKSSEEQLCEEHFVDNTIRQSDGRFVVKMPLKREISELGDSYATALKRFNCLERKFTTNTDLKNQYVNFINEYKLLGHMALVNDTSPKLSFYLPHHAVIKPEKLTSKIRVVFDGSSKSSSGVSLNDLQMVGPTIQNDLFTILIRFRKHKYAITSDISKMYRQVLIDPSQRSLQRILWRSSTEEPIQTYELGTVTYGTSAAPFLAIRSLNELAYQNKLAYPITSEIIKKDFYVDDLISGADSEQQLMSIIDELTQILNAGGFELRKWSSNNYKILNNLSQLESSQFHFIDSREASTILGLVWKPGLDVFKFALASIPIQTKVSKRTILSKISQLFDPLGLLGPIMILAKLFLQEIWQLKLSWDESIPSNLNSKWVEFNIQLRYLENLEIPRRVTINDSLEIQLHGFADASQTAYGACIYLRSRGKNNTWFSYLLCAKSRIAPLKIVTIPKLELCAALLLTKLMEKVKRALDINFDAYFYWSDSKITLSWINSFPGKWKIFVANRVSQIQELTQSQQWNYISSNQNPADPLSKGVSVSNLINLDLWWHGPPFMSSSDSLPIEHFNISNLPEQKSHTNLSLKSEIKECDLVTKYSSFSKLQAVTAYCLRFINNSKRNSIKLTNTLSPSELSHATERLILIVQNQHFANDINQIKKNSLSQKSKLISLNPCLEHGLWRVGGRLSKSLFSYQKKHPLILPKNSYLTELLIINEHTKLLHAGPTAVLNSLRNKFWPICGKNLVKKVIHRCITCFRANPKFISAIMGDLPTVRITPSRPFLNCGVDYAGPILIKDKKTRGCKLIKSYICLFICCVTKAVHLELVTDLSTETFLNSLRRFCSRRGKPQQILSDNGTNFVGANSELKELASFLSSNNTQIQTFASNQGINWHFIPPRASHFGGLWEAGVKSMKTHLKRVMKNTHLTYEGLLTVLTQIEACLNSRPLHPLSNDPADLNPLTPAHFLIGDTLTSIPEPDLFVIKESRLSLYQRQQTLIQHFWRRWSAEYISALQTRTKWQRSGTIQLELGTMVLVKEDNQPSLNWLLGRVVTLHPGADGVTRSATVKTTKGLMKRAYTKLCPLPLE